MKNMLVIFVSILLVSCVGGVTSPKEDRINPLGMRFVNVSLSSLTSVFVGQCEVRNVDFQVFSETRGLSLLVHRRERSARVRKLNSAEEQLPVLGVSFNEAQLFCEWLTLRDRESGFLKDGESYRLLSVQEAVMLNSNKCLPCDSNLLGEECFGTRLEPRGGEDSSYYELGHKDKYVFASPVASFRRDRLGLYDVSGNAREMYEYDFNEENNMVGLFGDAYSGRAFEDTILQTRASKTARLFDVGFRIVLQSTRKKSGAGSSLYRL